MNDPLLPCPFCGYEKHEEFGVRIAEPPQPLGGWVVLCGNCYCQTPARSEKEMAIEVWNRRADTRPSTRQERGEWRTIESAPRDGTAIIVRRKSDNYPTIGRFKENGWFANYAGTKFPEEWMPLPSPPKPSDEVGA